jgi:hypothetical protein
MKALSFGINCGTKWCERSELSRNTYPELRQSALRYREEIQSPSQSRIRPEDIPHAIGEINDMVKMLGARISELEKS